MRVPSETRLASSSVCLPRRPQSRNQHRSGATRTSAKGSQTCLGPAQGAWERDDSWVRRRGWGERGNALPRSLRVAPSTVQRGRRMPRELGRLLFGSSSPKHCPEAGRLAQRILLSKEARRRARAGLGSGHEVSDPADRTPSRTRRALRESAGRCRGPVAVRLPRSRGQPPPRRLMPPPQCTSSQPAAKHVTVAFSVPR